MKHHFIYLFLLSCCLVSCADTTTEYPFRNPELPLEQRVDDLIGRLTLEEKIAQMMHQTPAIERLGIPEYDWWNEALHGVARAGKATVFPQSIALAATFDEEAVRETFHMVSDEARAKYHQYQRDNEHDRYKGLTFWTPNINLFRDPRWGRGMETYGEDPYLTGRMGVAVVKGLQGDDSKYFKTHAGAKHFAAHSGPEWNRHEFDAMASSRDLWSTYLPAFEAVVKEGNVQEVMCGYNRFAGVPCCANNRLLTDILRNRWAFANMIVSDCWAIDDFWTIDTLTPRHETHPTPESAAAAAVRAGVDLECGVSFKHLPMAVEKGLITEAEIDASLRYVLKGRFELGMFDPDSLVPYSAIPYEVVESPAHVRQALEMARKSIVLLKNKDNALPLSKSLKKIAVVGPNANDSLMQWANYNGFPSKTVTILEGIRSKVPHAEVIYEQGCNHTGGSILKDLSHCITSSAGQGFDAEFYNNTHFTDTPIYKGSVNALHYITGGDKCFAPGVNPVDFTARFSGVFEAPSTGAIEFSLSGNDGFRLFIDKEKVMEMWESEYSGSHKYILQAEQGRQYPLTIEYMQRSGSAELMFSVGVSTPVDVKSVADKVRDADVIVFVGGISPALEGEELPVAIEGFKKGDRTDLEVPRIQRELIGALHATGRPIVYVACTGSALALTWEEAHVDAILNAWYGGQQGGAAVADVLFGDYNPAGRLPVTFYKAVSQLPDYEDYSMQGRTYRYMTAAPLYPFGYGLSYTSFKYTDATLSKSQIVAGETVSLLLRISNTGAVNGDEVVQVYVRNLNDSEAPLRELKAFKRVHVEAGKSKEVVLELRPDAFRSFDEATQSMEIQPGKYQILYGGSSAMKELTGLELSIMQE